jgi:mutual gliding-motility protein MglA
MASINRLRRELLFKVVFYGPGLGGKTTTLHHVHAATKPENRGNMLSLATDTDRTLYFDYLPVKLLRIGDVNVKLQLYTVPGQVYYAATRKLVLSGADGVVFVADTQSERLDSNLESLDDLNANLAEQGRKLSSLPHAFQWNKRDLPNLAPLDELDRRLNLFGAPSVPTVATTGEGVFELLERITRLVVEAYRAELPMIGAKPEGMPLFLDADEVGLTDAIKELADSRPARSSSTARLGLVRSPTKAALSPRSRSSARSSARSPSSHSPPASVSPASNSPSSPSSSSSAASSSLSPPSGVDQTPPGAAKVPSRSVPAPSSASYAPTSAPARTRAAGLAVPTNTGAFSLAELWAPADHESVRRVEQLLGAGEAGGAISACEDLLSRVLATASMLLGAQPHPRDPAVIVALLGIDGRRYLAFRAIARGVRAKRVATIREALECYAFAVEARRTLDRVSKGA